MSHSHDDLVYLAGLFDGEGTVEVRLAERSNRTPCWTVRIAITNTDGRVIHWLVDTFGGKVYSPKRVKSNKIVYQWSLSARPNKELIKELFPFLKIKKIQVEMLLEFLDLMGSTGYRITNHEEREEVAADIIDEKYKEYPYVVPLTQTQEGQS